MEKERADGQKGFEKALLGVDEEMGMGHGDEMAGEVLGESELRLLRELESPSSTAANTEQEQPRSQLLGKRDRPFDESELESKLQTQAAELEAKKSEKRLCMTRNEFGGKSVQ